MIVITKLIDSVRYVIPGDEFHMTIHDATGCEVIIREKITVSKVINFIATFRFALEDGICPGFHLTGIFANKDELPVEMKNAKTLSQLTKEQLKNFTESVGIEIKETKKHKPTKIT